MSDAAKIVDAFIAKTWGETRPEPYRKAMIAMVEQALTTERQRREECEAALRQTRSDLVPGDWRIARIDAYFAEATK